MLEILIVFLGGSIGATLRYFTSLAMHDVCDFYLVTLLINFLGSLFLGVVSYVVFNKDKDFNKNLKLFLTTGIAGGYTTFSTFSYEVFQLIQSNQVITGFVYMFGSLFFSLFAIMLGFALSKQVFTMLPSSKLAFQEDDIEDELIEDEEELVEELVEV